MKKSILFILSISLFVASCGNDDTPIGETPENQGYQLVAIGEDGQDLYQFAINTSTGDTTTTNLSEELNIDGFFLTLRQVQDELSFFSFRGGFFSWAKKDVVSGSTQIFNDFYEDTPERSIVWGTNSENSIYFGYFGPSGTRNLALFQSTVASSFEDSSDLSLEFNIENLYQPVYFGNKLFMTYEDSSGQFKVTVINTLDNTVITNLNFANEPPALFITEDNNLGVIQLGASNNRTLTILDLDNLTELDSYSTETNLPFTIGELQNTHFENGTLYFSTIYPQPSPINFGPAVYDFLNDELFVPDLTAIIADFENESGKRITLTSQGFSINQKMFYIGYAETEVQGTQAGGIFVIDTKGQLIDQIATDFAPFYFVKD